MRYITPYCIIIHSTGYANDVRLISLPVLLPVCTVCDTGHFFTYRVWSRVWSIIRFHSLAKTPHASKSRTSHQSVQVRCQNQCWIIDTLILRARSERPSILLDTMETCCQMVGHMQSLTEKMGSKVLCGKAERPCASGYGSTMIVNPWE